MKRIYLFLLAFGTWGTLTAQTPCSLDSTFDTDGKMVSDGGRMGEHIVIQNSGKPVIACNPFGDGQVFLKRFNDDGTVDATFGSGGSRTIQVAERATRVTDMLLKDDMIYVCGTTTTNIGGTNTYAWVGVLDANGNFVSTFGTAGIKSFSTGPDLYKATALAVDAAGNIFVAGLEWLDNLFVMKLSPNGYFDGSWDVDGIVYVPTGNVNHWWEVNDMILDSEGKIVLGGKKQKANNGSPDPVFWNMMIARFNSNGNLDFNFGTGGIGLYNYTAGSLHDCHSIHEVADKKYVAAGNTYQGADYDYSAIRVGSTGTLDNTFGTGGWSINDLTFTGDQEYSLSSAALPDGRILITGNQGDGDTVHFALLMLSEDGTRDNVFAPNGVYTNIFNTNNNSSSSGLAVYPSGKIILSGYTRTCANGVCGPLYMGTARYNNTFMATTGNETPFAEADLVLYPNPVESGGVLQIVFAEKTEGITLTAMDGKSVELLNENGWILPELPAGMYACTIFTQNGTITRKIQIR